MLVPELTGTEWYHPRYRVRRAILTFDGAYWTCEDEDRSGFRRRVVLTPRQMDRWLAGALNRTGCSRNR